MNIKHLSGLIAAPFTPMKANGEVNLSLIPDYYRLLKSNGNSGAFICGSTGEGVSLTIEEKKDLAFAWSAATKDDHDFKVITLVGGTCVRDSIDLAMHARTLNLYAVAFTAPFYFKPPDIRSLGECCKMIADSVASMPFYYYHIPQLTGVDFPMIRLVETLDGLVPNFAGIKYTHEDFMDFLSCVNFKNGKYDMLWGRDESLLSALAVGAKGGVGSTYNYAAPLYIELIKAYKQGNYQKARELQQQSIDMIRLLGKYGGISVGKAYMKLIGLDCGEFRLPVKNMNAQQFELFSKDVKALQFHNFCSRFEEVIDS